MPNRRLFLTTGIALIVCGATPDETVRAQSNAIGRLSTMQILERLRTGGSVLVMRHADSPFRPPDAGEAEADNPRRERQLDATGKANARAIGRALRRLHISIGPIYSSPTYRALETVRLARLGSSVVVDQLAEGPHGMAQAGEDAQSQWLRRAANVVARPGSNTLIVTHAPNIVGAFGAAATDVQPGEMLVFEPARGGPAQLIGRLKVADWNVPAEAR